MLLAEHDSFRIDENLMRIKLPLGGITMTTFVPDKGVKNNNRAPPGYRVWSRLAPLSSY